MVQKDVSKYIENPLNAFKIIKRHVLDMEQFKKEYPELIEMSGIDKLIRFPSEVDLIGSIKGLVRLQRVYNLTTEDLSNGIINKLNTGIKLSTRDLYIIGNRLSAVQGEEYFAVEYLQLALRKSTNEKIPDFPLFQIYETLFTFFLKKNNFNRANEIIDRLNREEREIMIQKHWILYDRVKLHVNPYAETFKRNGLYSHEKETILFRKVCRGEIRKSPKEESNLTCRFHSTNSFTKLARFKVQIMNVNPEILLFIDVVSEKEIEIMDDLFMDSETTTASVISYNKNETSVINNDNRVADLVWFADKDHWIFPKLTTRLEDMTGLSMKTAEKFQIQNYGVAGHFNLHWDQNIKTAPYSTVCRDGNRIATVMFYVSLCFI